MMRIGSIQKKEAGEGDESEEDQRWFYLKKKAGKEMRMSRTSFILLCGVVSQILGGWS